MTLSLVSFSPEDTIFDVAKALSKYNITGAPVLEDDKLVGVISVTDIIKHMKTKLPKEKISGEVHHLSIMFANLLKEQFDFKTDLKNIGFIKVRDLMSTDVISISPNETLIDAANLMEKNDIDRLPVVEDGKLLGIISRIDLVKALLE
jgi:CBS domain-containing protein